MQSELKRCPFCGGIAERIDIEDGDNAGGSFIHCTMCGASGNVEFGFKENFISNWNRRSSLSDGEPDPRIGNCDIEEASIDDGAEIAARLAQPAPSVAVKALSAIANYRHHSRLDSDENAEAMEQIARSALSAQVQDVAPLKNVRGEVTHEGICNTHEGGPCNCDWSAADEDEPHPDDIAADRFAAAMKAKLAKKRDQGRSGWEDKDDCSQVFLSQLLREHVEKGDPVDVGNFAMFLHQRGESILSLLVTLQGE